MLTVTGIVMLFYAVGYCAKGAASLVRALEPYLKKSAMTTGNNLSFPAGWFLKKSA